VNRDILCALIGDACQAPSGSNIQPWEYVIVDEPSLLHSITTYSPGIGRCPPAMIVLCADQERALQKGGKLGKEQLALMDISMAAENLILSAVERNLGTCAVKSFPVQVIGKLLDLPDHVVPELIVILGEPAMQPQSPPKRNTESLIHYNGWGK